MLLTVSEVVEVEHDQAERLAARARAATKPILERAVVEQAGQVVGLGADLDGLEDLGVLERDRDLRREQLDQLELVGRERVADAESFDRQDADRAVSPAQRDDDQAAVLASPPRGSG